MTGDDEGRLQADGEILQPRGRQNVVMELGYFLAKLGRRRVVVLVDAKVERPSDIQGLMYKTLDAAGAWKYQLAKELKAVGIIVDLDKIK